MSRSAQTRFSTSLRQLASKAPGLMKSPSSTMPVSPISDLGAKTTWDSCDPYSYTGGRWLNRDRLQRTSRFIDFDFSELCNTAMKLFPQASKVVDCVKKEGGFNRVFIFTLDSGHRVVARLPTRIAGPPRLTTNSEVATIDANENISSDPKNSGVER
ncbi:hypothetical protein MAP00_002785 [Monascus purpureus]|nr:hypothetical protein MAP00_002785 [Monascus purpureus]